MTALESCPRRWMLERADYPELWDRHGYPTLPVRAALFGTVVHRIVERLSDAMGSTDDAKAPLSIVGVLQSLGGWAQLAVSAVEEALTEYENNPRIVHAALDRLRDDLTRRVPDAIDQAKLLLRNQRSTTPSVRSVRTTRAVPQAVPRLPAAPGTHLERVVTIEDLRLSGRVDLLSVDEVDVMISDFKTGAEREEHDDQVRFYALLWRFDALTNPLGRPTTKLSITYPSHERVIPAPDERELLALYESTETRIAEADAVVASPSPVALPSTATCQFCQVNHLCAAYWANVPPHITEAPVGEWFDMEGHVMRRNGSRSWIFETLEPSNTEVLVRTAETDMAFPVGRHVRLLGVRRSLDPDTPERLVVSLSTTSEWYLVRS